MPDAACVLKMPLVHATRLPQTDTLDSNRPWFGLLELFYQQAGLPMPTGRKLRPTEIPQPYRGLLVHSRDMTPTLAAFYAASLGLEVLSRRRHGDCYFREVVLTAKNRPVEYGVIRILLEHFPSAARELVLEERTPLGAILSREGIAHVSWPQAFFETETDDHMRGVLGIPENGTLFGRRNVLLDGARRLLAEVVEILAPTPGNTKDTSEQR